MYTYKYIYRHGEDESQDSQKVATMRPRMAKMRPKMTKMTLKMVKMRPKMAKMRRKMAKMRPIFYAKSQYFLAWKICGQK